MRKLFFFPWAATIDQWLYNSIRMSLHFFETEALSILDTPEGLRTSPHPTDKSFVPWYGGWVKSSGASFFSLARYTSQMSASFFASTISSGSPPQRGGGPLPSLTPLSRIFLFVRLP